MEEVEEGIADCIARVSQHQHSGPARHSWIPLVIRRQHQASMFATLARITNQNKDDIQLSLHSLRYPGIKITGLLRLRLHTEKRTHLLHPARIHLP